MTEWRAIPGYEGYEASDDGQVRSIPRTIERSGPKGSMNLAGKVLSFHVIPGGYRRVTLSGTHHLVHVLVLRAFIGEPPSGHQARHINGDPSDNRVENLAWGTPSENTKDQVTHGTHNYGSRDSCLRGHAYGNDPPRRKDGSRRCRPCEALRASNHRRKEEPA